MDHSSRILLSFIGFCLSSTTLAAILPRQAVPCTFSMTAIGMDNSTVKQSSIGEPRIGGEFPQGFYLLENGTLTDARNHTCFISSSTSQLQCVQGFPEATTFTFSDDFLLRHDTNPSWLACPPNGPGDDGSYNIFSDAKQNKIGCKNIQLQAGGFACAVLGRPSSTATSTPSATARATCPTNINSGNFQFPHLIVPTSPQAPDYAFGNSYKAYMSPINTTLFNFDIPATTAYTGTCSLLFLFPFSSETDPSAGKYYYSGMEQVVLQHGGLDFSLLSGTASAATTYNTTPTVIADLGKVAIIPGNNYTVATFPCQTGKAITIQGSSFNGTELDYFQDSAPTAIGLYIVPCA
ncbi:ubiquitin 3 binding protein But2 C-terminal domain-containing protein [Tricladium varicosporioides]|nr:ubiquitin 3 binding protein But2 C-terminal domain-containing protein [Hymenoscyphus varicosporioides]